MKFSLGWLREHVELPEDAAEVARRLTAIGHSVEGVEGEGDAAVLDVDVTTNRPDCMNHRGLARELATAFARSLRPLPEALPAPDGGAGVPVTIEDAGGCSRYVALVLEGVEVAPSPEWLARRLEAIGLRAINNVVDVTNYVLWDLGQPLHAFDLDRLAGPEIRVRAARPGERLVTLDGVERTLEPEALVIADRDRAVALAGIMGGQETEVTSATRRVLLESAHFDRRRVRRGARGLGMHTDASHRFERGADPEICRLAAERAAALLAAAGGARPAGAPWDERTGPPVEIPWRIETAALDAFTGVPLAPDAVEGYLTRLGFAPRRAAAGSGWQGSVPSWRLADFEPRTVERDGAPALEAWPADLYEEVLRFHGFDSIPATLPALPGPDEGDDERHRRRERLRDELAYSGLAEAIHFAFHAREADARFPGIGGAAEPVALANPLSERYAVLRRSLLPNLVETAGLNCRRGAAAVGLFELGRLFPGGEAEEVEAVAILLGGRPGLAWFRRPELDLFDLKGIVEGVALRFGVELAAEPAALAGFVEGTAARLRDGEGREYGYLGRVDGEETPFPLYAAEIFLAPVLAPRPAAAGIDLPPRLPGVAADLTFTHPLEVEWREIAAAIQAAAIPDLRWFGLKDRYTGEGVPAGAVNTTIAFRYNAEARSLTQEEVNERQERVAALLAGRWGWQGGARA